MSQMWKICSIFFNQGSCLWFVPLVWNKEYSKWYALMFSQPDEGVLSQRHSAWKEVQILRRKGFQGSKGQFCSLPGRKHRRKIVPPEQSSRNGKEQKHWRERLTLFITYSANVGRGVLEPTNSPQLASTKFQSIEEQIQLNKWPSYLSLIRWIVLRTFFPCSLRTPKSSPFPSLNPDEEQEKKMHELFNFKGVIIQ